MVAVNQNCSIMWLLGVFLSLAVVCFSRAHFGDLVVQTSSGSVEGWERISRDGRLYQAWTGIPYAEPPVGELRLKPPKPISPWNGVLNATGDSPTCLQSSGMGFSNMAEDCLYLSVYRPKINKENMPVLFHVHGGGFQSGGMGPREIADFLMDEDIIFVGIQYRLNAFGFMSLGDAVMPGNFGLKDQVLALKWVKQNIASFGGNPNSVTVFGESAGAASTHILLKSPATDGLVHRAVSDSGTVNRFWSLLKSDNPRRNTVDVAKACGCMSENSEEVLKCLQNVDAACIMSNMMSLTKEPSNQLFMPVIEPEDAVDPVATFDLSLRPTEKPWMTSTTNGEWLLFKMALGPKDYSMNTTEYLISYLSSLPITMSKTQIIGAAETFEKFYFSGPRPTTTEVAKLEGDMSFIYPVMANIAMNNGPKWVYRYEYVSEISEQELLRLNITEQIASHASPFYLYLNLRSMFIPSRTVERPQDYEVSKRLIKYLVNFAYHDDPTPAGSPFKWKQFKNGEILRVTGLGDFYADNEYLQELNDVYKLWDSTVGWHN